MTKVKTIAGPITISRWADNGGGFNESKFLDVEDRLQEAIDSILANHISIKDIKVNHFTVQRHNNGGADEVWVQYTILY